MRKLMMAVQKMKNHFRAYIYSSLWRIPFEQLGQGVNLDLRGSFNVKKGLRIGRNVSIIVEEGASLSIGSNVYIGEGCYIKCYGGDLRIGNDVSINAHAFINACGGVSIGNDTRIATKFICIASNHIFSDPNVLMRKQGITKEGIDIGNNVWLGANVKVLDGVNISDNCIIAAGAVVNKNLYVEGVYAGVPAKFKKNIPGFE